MFPSVHGTKTHTHTYPLSLCLHHFRHAILNKYHGHQGYHHQPSFFHQVFTIIFITPTTHYNILTSANAKSTPAPFTSQSTISYHIFIMQKQATGAISMHQKQLHQNFLLCETGFPERQLYPCGGNTRALMPVVEKEMMSLGEPRQNLKPKLHKKGVKTTRIEVTSCKVKPLLFFRVKSTCTDGFCMVLHARCCFEV